MNGLIALLGSGEYLPVMDEVDRHLLASLRANGHRPRVACLPTASGREGEASVTRWSKMGIDHFNRLDADVKAVPIIDWESARDPRFVSVLENADLIYFSGGDPGYLFQVLQGSPAWLAAQSAWQRGAVYAGCSAGAMILGRQIPNFRFAGLRSISAFGILPVTFIMPHFNAIPKIWRPLINGLRRRLQEDGIMLGIDENTALVGRLGEPWTVMGAATVQVMRRDTTASYRAGESVSLGNNG